MSLQNRQWLIVSISGLAVLGFFWYVLIDAKEAAYNTGYYLGYDNGRTIGLEKGDSIGYNRGFNTKYSDLLKIEEVFKNLQLKFQPQVNYVNIVNSVAEVGSGNSNLEYQNLSKILTSIDRELISFLSKNFNLSKQDQNIILAQYNQVSTKLNKEAFNELSELNKTIHSTQEKTIYSRKKSDGVKNFDKVLSRKMCKVASLVNSHVIHATASSVFAKVTTTEICPHLLRYALKPLVYELKKRALIDDYEVSNTQIRKEVSNRIIELATAEYQSSASRNKVFERNIDWGWFGDSKHTATIGMQAFSTTKAGFDLANKFSLRVDHTQRSIFLELPQPVILSHEVRMETKNVDDGSWFIELDSDDFNVARSELEDLLLNRAINSSLGNEAISNAENVLKVIFNPLATSMPFPYSVKIKIGNGTTKTLIDHSNLDIDDFII